VRRTARRWEIRTGTVTSGPPPGIVRAHCSHARGGPWGARPGPEGSGEFPVRNLGSVAALAASFLLSACGSSTAPVDAAAGAAGLPPCNPGPRARVVVAVIDSAINPYHEYFNAGGTLYPGCTPSSVTPEVLAELGVPAANVLEVTRTGNIARDRKTDQDTWAAVRRGRPYWFKGTNIIGISFSSPPLLVPTPEKEPHGTATAASVLAANPDAIILFVETWDDLANDDSHGYAFLHPAVDILSTSYGAGLPFVPVGTGVFLPEARAFLGSFDAVVRMGKLHFSSAGNSSGFTPGRAGAGPWWSIGVSGFEEYSTNGDQQGVSGNFPDFVSDFTQDQPYCMDCEKGLQEVPGTSFSTPRAAGVASRVLLEARRALGHEGGIVLDGSGAPLMAAGAGTGVSNWQLRRALEKSAYAGYSAADYDPSAMAGDPWPTSTPVIDAAPWLQIGWGDLTTDAAKGVIEGALGHLGLGTPPPAKPAAFCDFQTKVMEERIHYWSTVALDADEHPADPMPYLFCGSALPSP
jgi:hypothetical protein